MDLNKTMLIGRLGNDPELKYTQSGIAVVSFSMATSTKWKGQDGNWQEKTEWHNIKAWKGLAETCSNYLKKGSKIYAEGRLETSTWETDGKKNSKTEIVLDNMIMLDNKKEETKTETKPETVKGDLPF
jgi:single-strand DNA-binding protein